MWSRWDKFNLKRYDRNKYEVEENKILVFRNLMNTHTYTHTLTHTHVLWKCKVVIDVCLPLYSTISPLHLLLLPWKHPKIESLCIIQIWHHMCLVEFPRSRVWDGNSCSNNLERHSQKRGEWNRTDQGEKD